MGLFDGILNAPVEKFNAGSCGACTPDYDNIVRNICFSWNLW